MTFEIAFVFALLVLALFLFATEWVSFDQLTSDLIQGYLTDLKVEPDIMGNFNKKN